MLARRPVLEEISFGRQSRLRPRGSSAPLRWYLAEHRGAGAHSFMGSSTSRNVNFSSSAFYKGLPLRVSYSPAMRSFGKSAASALAFAGDI